MFLEMLTPAYVPGETIMISPVAAASCADWIVAYWEGTERVAAKEDCGDTKKNRIMNPPTIIL
ncbi:MAG: hypothetical protein A3K03_09710 [Bdellovibrionales bacterium RIFOXYD1_FULL_44_7]|nr:MAG: hypothetical protein A3K03_09710 [Bdellovibrionales bacterium RIFOXYD1_FULL_44_7]